MQLLPHSLVPLLIATRPMDAQMQHATIPSAPTSVLTRPVRCLHHLKSQHELTHLLAVNASSSFNVLQCTYPFSNDSISRDPQWCCRSATDYDNCCSDPDLTFNDTQNIGLFLTPGSTEAMNPAEDYVLASDCTTNSSSAANSTASACPADNSAAVGGAVGGVLGALLLGAVAAAILLLRGRKTLKAQVQSTTMQRDDALRQVSDEKALMTQLRQQQDAHQAHFAAAGPGGAGTPAMYGYQQSGALGYGQSPVPGYSEEHIYGQYTDSGSLSMQGGVRSPMGPLPAEMASAVKVAEMDGNTYPTGVGVQEVKPTPEASARGGSVMSKSSP